MRIYISNLLLLNFALATSMALCSGSALAKEKPLEQKVVLLNFPAGRSLGTLKINVYKRDPQTGEMKSKSEKFYFTGTVSVPTGMNSTFKLGYDGVQQLNTLVKIVGKYDLIKDFDADNQPLTDKQIAEVAKISSIKRLNLSHTDMSDAGLKGLLVLKDLENLNVVATTITPRGIAILPAFQKLTVVNLDKNNLDDSIGSDLSKMPAVIDLSLRATKISDACLPDIAKLKTITQLALASNSGITDKGIAKLVTLKNLVHLDVTDTKVTTKGLEILKKIPLQVLKVRDNKFTKAQMDRLRAVFPKTEIKDASRGGDIDQSLFAPLHSPFEKGSGF